MGGADTPSVSQFKSQFSGTLTPYYVVTSQNLKARAFTWSVQRIEGWGVADWLKKRLLSPERGKQRS
jgi:hypothetical protein